MHLPLVLGGPGFDPHSWKDIFSIHINAVILIFPNQEWQLSVTAKVYTQSTG